MFALISKKYRHNNWESALRAIHIYQFISLTQVEWELEPARDPSYLLEQNRTFRLKLKHCYRGSGGGYYSCTLKLFTLQNTSSNRHPGIRQNSSIVEGFVFSLCFSNLLQSSGSEVGLLSLTAAHHPSSLRHGFLGCPAWITLKEE